MQFVHIRKETLHWLAYRQPCLDCFSRQPCRSKQWLRLLLAQLKALENPKPIRPIRDQRGDLSRGGKHVPWRPHRREQTKNGGDTDRPASVHGSLDQRLLPNRGERQCKEWLAVHTNPWCDLHHPRGRGGWGHMYWQEAGAGQEPRHKQKSSTKSTQAPHPNYGC